MIRKWLVWLLPVFLLAPGIARAEVDAPDALVRNVTEEVLAILRADKGIRAGDQQRAVTLVEQKVAPHFDFARMTSLAVGRAWRQADEAQRKALTGEFRALLVRTYANTLTAYRDQTVRVNPSSRAGADDEVTVHTQINKPGAQPVSLDYSLTRAPDGWKVFDVVIANVSLVTSYRNSFAGEVERGGVAGLLKALQEKNRQRQNTPPPAA